MKISREVLELGQEIVDQLNPKNDNDILAAWIAQDLAEKLKKYAKASGAERTRLGGDIFDLILKVWKHRASLPSAHRPFERYDAIFRALESFDPEKDEYRYFFDGFPPVEKEKKGEVEKWLDTARVVDRAARSLITFCIGSASAAAGQPKKVWLKAARTLKMDDELEIRIVFLTSEMARQHTDVAARKKAQLGRMRDKIDAFASIGSLIREEIDKQIKRI